MDVNAKKVFSELCPCHLWIISPALLLWSSTSQCFVVPLRVSCVKVNYQLLKVGRCNYWYWKYSENALKKCIHKKNYLLRANWEFPLTPSGWQNLSCYISTIVLPKSHSSLSNPSSIPGMTALRGCKILPPSPPSPHTSPVSYFL